MSVGKLLRANKVSYLRGLSVDFLEIPIMTKDCFLQEGIDSFAPLTEQSARIPKF